MIALALVGCAPTLERPRGARTCGYLAFRTPGDVQAGGVQVIQLRDGHKVWTKRFGNGPIKVLLLHGGPGLTHEYMECFESFFPQAGIEFYEYDQLGSAYSDQPDDDALWTIDRFVDELEQVRRALGLDETNFYLLGHSWGGILAIEYALKHQDHLKGIVIANMTADFRRYAAYNAKLRAELPRDVRRKLEAFESRGAYHDPAYEELVFNAYYTQHLCRLPEWPEPATRSLRHVDQHVYEYMQGPSEFVPGGILKEWSAWDRLRDIRVPTLTVGAKYDTMDPRDLEAMSRLVQRGRYLYCPNGSHLAMWDDQQVFMTGIVRFLEDVQAGRL